jgi:hypothetical protein
VWTVSNLKLPQGQYRIYVTIGTDIGSNPGVATWLTPSVINVE